MIFVNFDLRCKVDILNPSTMFEVTIVLCCTSTGKELRQRLKVPETVADLQAFIQARFSIPKCLQKLKFEDTTLLVGSQKLTNVYIRNEDSIVVEYLATAEVDQITNLCRHLHSVVVNFRELFEANDHLKGYSSISDEAKSAVEQVRGLLHTVAFSCLIPWHQVPEIEANRQLLNQEDGMKLTTELLSLLLEAPFHSLGDSLQLLLIACLSLMWNFAETRASRLAVVQLGGFQLMMKALLVHRNDHTNKAEMFDLFDHAVGCISNYSEIEECQLQLAQSSPALDLLLSFAIHGSPMNVFTKMLIANCVFRLSHNATVHPRLGHPDILEKILQFFTTFEKILGLTYYNMVIGYVLSVALARLVLLSSGVVPDQFQSRIIKLLDSFLAKAKAAGSNFIAAAEEKLQCNWLTMVPFIDVFMIPLHATSHGQYGGIPSTTQSSLSIMMFALTIEMSRKCSRELVIRQGLLDFIVSLPWNIPDKWRENSRSVVAAFQKDIRYLPVPKLYSIAASCAARHGMHALFSK